MLCQRKEILHVIISFYVSSKKEVIDTISCQIKYLHFVHFVCVCIHDGSTDRIIVVVLMRSFGQDLLNLRIAQLSIRRPFTIDLRF